MWSALVMMNDVSVHQFITFLCCMCVWTSSHILFVNGMSDVSSLATILKLRWLTAFLFCRVYGNVCEASWV